MRKNNFLQRKYLQKNPDDLPAESRFKRCCNIHKNKIIAISIFFTVVVFTIIIAVTLCQCNCFTSIGFISKINTTTTTSTTSTLTTTTTSDTFSLRS